MSRVVFPPEDAVWHLLGLNNSYVLSECTDQQRSSQVAERDRNETSVGTELYMQGEVDIPGDEERALDSAAWACSPLTKLCGLRGLPPPLCVCYLLSRGALIALASGGCDYPPPRILD